MWTLERNLGDETLLTLSNSMIEKKSSCIYSFAKHSTNLSVPAVTAGRRGSFSSFAVEESCLSDRRNSHRRHSMTPSFRD